MSIAKELYELNKEIAEKFIFLIKNQHNLHLDFSKVSISKFESIFDELKNTKETKESLYIGMAAYLGHLLLSLFDGEWFQNDLGLGVSLKNTGFGEFTEVYPRSWIEKRITNCNKDSIEFKIAVLKAININGTSTNPEWSEDKMLAKEYARNLNISNSEEKIIDQLILSILGNQEDLNVIDLIQVNDSVFKYLRGRLIKLQDLHPFNFNMLNKVEDIYKCFQTRKLTFSEEEFIFLLEYLQNSQIHPNGQFFKNIWAIERDSSFFKRAKSQFSTTALNLMLKSIANKLYHHDIIDFKKILNLVKQENIETIKFLYSNNFQFKQGCYKVIKYILE